MGDVDLFGLPIDPGHGCRGRPRHVPTPNLRAKVRELRDAGAAYPAICAAIGITEPTLVRHYHEELRSRSQVWRRWAAKDGGNEPCQ